MSIYPALGVCQVTGRSANPWGVYVLNPTIQATGVLVKMGLSGSADSLRVNQPPLPTEGTWGLCAWPYGDSRNGVWICSIYTQGNSALLNSSPDVDYQAHPSGAWTLIDQIGNATLALPDGSYVTFGNGGTKPELTRQIVNAAQQVVNIPYPDITRQIATPPTFPFTFSSASGTTIKVDTSGNVDINLNSGATLNITQGGTPVDFLALVSKLVTAFNQHYHVGSSISDVPEVQWTANTIKSVLVEVQS